MNGERIHPAILEAIDEAEEKVRKRHANDKDVHMSGLHVFGTKEKYITWMTTPHPELGGRPPHVLLLEGCEEDVLHQAMRKSKLEEQGE